MGKRILIIFELILFFTTFSLTSSLLITDYQDKRIVDITEDFAETVRYKGCITTDMYYDALKEYPVPIKISFIVDKYNPLLNPGIMNQEFTEEVINDLLTYDIYKMNTKDSIKIIVRRVSPDYFNTVTSLFASKSPSAGNIIAVKGGMILNEQYH